MNNWPRLAIIALMIASLGLIFWAQQKSSAPDPPLVHASRPNTVPVSISEDVADRLREGDIIFRGKDFSWGDLGAQLSDKDQRFGHVGVIVRNNDGWAIIDAIGNPLDGEGSVRLRTITEFLAPATRIGIYRPALTAASLKQFLTEIRRYEVTGTPFDRLYDLQDDSALYCTELIWRALKVATGTEQVLDQTVFRGRRIIAIDDLQYAPLMTEIWIFDPAP